MLQIHVTKQAQNKHAATQTNLDRSWLNHRGRVAKGVGHLDHV